MTADAYYEKRRKAAILMGGQAPGSWPPWHELSPRERQQWRREALEQQGVDLEGPSCEVPDDRHLFPELEPNDP